MDCILTEIQIEAPILFVWQVLTDFKAYSEWNPYMVEVTATFAVGQQLQFLQNIPAGSSAKIRAIFTHITPGNEFRWQHHSKVPFLLAVERYCTLEAVDATTTRLRHGQNQTGLCVSLLNSVDYFEKPLRGMVAMNNALKARCEIKASDRHNSVN